MKLSAWKIAATLVGLVFATSVPAKAGDSGMKGGYQPPWIATYSGVDFANNSVYAYSGAVVSLQRDLSRSGFVFQGFAGYGSYTYISPGIFSSVDGDVTQLAASLGYLFIGQGISVGVYAGVDYQNHDLSPFDPFSPVSGSKSGLRIGGDIRSIGPRHYFTLEGYYSTAFETYWARARAGMNFGRLVVGPEAVVLGNDGFDAQRIGAFTVIKLDLQLRNPVELTLNSGYQFLDDVSFGSFGGGEGWYGGVNVTFVF
jgi:hypothetical protein